MRQRKWKSLLQHQYHYLSLSQNISPSYQFTTALFRWVAMLRDVTEIVPSRLWSQLYRLGYLWESVTSPLSYPLRGC